MKKLFSLLLLMLTACTSSKYPTSDVMITNLAENSGGSGTVIAKGLTYSWVLTNKHVCKVVEHGGLVINSYGVKSKVVTYIPDPDHDLCAIAVFADLGTPVKLAPADPDYLSTSVSIGHPHLLPTMVTTGNFSSHAMVSILVGVKQCTSEDAASDRTGMCGFLGILPIVKSYEAVAVSNLVQPGSSGSGVFNLGRLSAVIFAGSGDMSFGLAVPFAYVDDFVRNFSTFKPEFPDDNPLADNTKLSVKDFKKVLFEKCGKSSLTSTQEKVCSEYLPAARLNDLIYSE